MTNVPPKPHKAPATTMLVLGAGASIGGRRYPIYTGMQHEMMDMPGTKGFFYELMSRRRNGKRDFLNFLGVRHEALEKMILRVWGFPYTNRSAP
jgi:hypothetical protein